MRYIYYIGISFCPQSCATLSASAPRHLSASTHCAMPFADGNDAQAERWIAEYAELRAHNDAADTALSGRAWVVAVEYNFRSHFNVQDGIATIALCHLPLRMAAKAGDAVLFAARGAQRPDRTRRYANPERGAVARRVGHRRRPYAAIHVPRLERARMGHRARRSHIPLRSCGVRAPRQARRPESAAAREPTRPGGRWQRQASEQVHRAPGVRNEARLRNQGTCALPRRWRHRVEEAPLRLQRESPRYAQLLLLAEHRQPWRVAEAETLI